MQRFCQYPKPTWVKKSLELSPPHFLQPLLFFQEHPLVGAPTDPIVYVMLCVIIIRVVKDL